MHVLCSYDNRGDCNTEWTPLDWHSPYSPPQWSWGSDTDWNPSEPPGSNFCHPRVMEQGVCRGCYVGHVDDIHWKKGIGIYTTTVYITKCTQMGVCMCIHMYTCLKMILYVSLNICWFSGFFYQLVSWAFSVTWLGNKEEVKILEILLKENRGAGGKNLRLIRRVECQSWWFLDLILLCRRVRKVIQWP